MQEKKPPFKVISIVLFAVAAVFIALAVVIGIKYHVTPQKMNTKVYSSGVLDDTDSHSSDDEAVVNCDDFTVTKDGAAGAAETASGAVQENADGGSGANADSADLADDSADGQ